MSIFEGGGKQIDKLDKLDKLTKKLRQFQPKIHDDKSMVYLEVVGWTTDFDIFCWLSILNDDAIQIYFVVLNCDGTGVKILWAGIIDGAWESFSNGGGQ